MPFSPLKRVDAKDPEVRQLQDAVTAALKDLTLKELLDGHLVQAVAIVSGTPKTVNHGLERAPQWVVVRKNANANVWDSQDTNTTSKRTLVLNASANVTVDLWVF